MSGRRYGQPAGSRGNAALRPVDAGRNRREDLVLKDIEKHLRVRGGSWFLKVRGAGTMQRRGVPDLIVCYLGMFCAFEVKRPSAPDSAVTPLQQVNLELIRRQGGEAHVVRSVEEVAAVLDRIDEEFGAVGGRPR